MKLAADGRLLNHQPNYGVWDLKGVQAWTVMEVIAGRQMAPARWEKIDDGYILIPATWFGQGFFFWFGSTFLLALSMLGLRWRDVIQERKKGLSGVTDVKVKPVADLGTA